MAVREIYDSPLFNDANLVAYHRLEDVSDSKGANTLTNNGSVVFSSAKFTNGANLGTGNTTKSLTCANDFLSLIGDYSISFQVKGIDAIASGTWVLLGLDNDANNTKIKLDYEYNGGTKRIVFHHTRWGGSDYTFTYNFDLGTSSFYNFILIKNGTTEKLYINGSEVGTQTDANLSSAGVTSFSPRIGLYLGSSDLPGDYSAIILDDCAFFSRYFTTTEIGQINNGWQSASQSPSSSSSASLSPSSSISASNSASQSMSNSLSPSFGYTGYTKGNLASLPGNDNDLANNYTEQQVIDVSTHNGVMVSQTGTQEYMIHEYKNFVSDKVGMLVSWIGQTTLAPSSSIIKLQIFNRNTNSWDDLDSDNTSAINTDIELSATIGDFTNYKDARNVISCRVWQLAT